MITGFVLALIFSLSPAHADEAPAAHGFSAAAKENVLWLKIRATDRNERSVIADTGVSIEAFRDDYVIALGSPEQRDRLAAEGKMLSSFAIDERTWDFPSEDARFHNYDRMLAGLRALAQANPDIATLDSIGQSVERREIWRLRITKDPATGDSKPGVAYLGGHHAREHLSVEIPILFAKRLIEGYRAGEPAIVRLIESRDIHIVPMVNPDGAEFDIATGRYQMWRKNRAPVPGGKFGVDLNRNYGYRWGTGGSSSNPGDDTYKGPAAFSEPETQAIKAFVDRQSNLTILLSTHTFSELILYPWGSTYDPVTPERDKRTFQTMAQKMATWNGYKPQQASELYIASGDTCDWAYGQHKIFAFTFELDPKSMWSGGFYPGQAVIEPVFRKNLPALLYLADLADNPYRAIEPNAAAYGFSALSLR